MSYDRVLSNSLHWGSNYSTKLRRCIHGGFAEFSAYPTLEGYIHTLSPAAQAMFRRWDARSHEKRALTAQVLKVAAGLGPPGLSYDAALAQLHPGGDSASRRQSTVYLSKQARRIFSLKNNVWGLWWGADDPEAERDDAKSIGPIHLQWGEGITALFNADEARRVWRAFEGLDAQLRECFARAQADCEGCKRNDGSYNCTMPAVLEPAAPLRPNL
jgi:hypothetical protein